MAGHDNYPKTLTDAYNMLLEWKDDPRLLMRMAGNDGISFTTTTTETNEEQDIEVEGAHPKETETTHSNTTLGQGGRGRSAGRNGGRGGRGGNRDNIQCFRCVAMGHYASQCPETLEDAQRMLEENAETGTNMLQHATIAEQPPEPTGEMFFAALNLDGAEDNDTSFVFVISRMDPAGQPVHRGRIHQSTIAQKYTQSKEEHAYTLYCWCGQNKPCWGPSRIWYCLVPSQRDCQYTVLIQSQGKISRHF